MNDQIPIINLKAQYKRLKPEIMAAVEEVFESSAFIQGKYVKQFENEFRDALKVSHGVGCSNGTSAIILALKALGIGEGDEVITVAHTFVATAEAICQCGAKPVFVDIDPKPYTIDPDAVESAITAKTRAIIPVHIYGAPCDMDPILEIARRNNVVVIEDCAQAHLSTYKGKCVGGLGDAGTFSFYPAKNLGAFGDAGLVTTNNDETASLARKLLDHGRSSKHKHDIIGYNFRMDGVQAAILSVKLRYLKENNNTRRVNAALYDSRLRKAGFKVIESLKQSEPVYHLYIVEVSNRHQVAEHLRANQIEYGVHYPTPLHLQPAFGNSGYKRGDLPVTETVAGRAISLPLCPEITGEQIKRVCDRFLEIAEP